MRRADWGVIVLDMGEVPEPDVPEDERHLWVAQLQIPPVPQPPHNARQEPT